MNGNLAGQSRHERKFSRTYLKLTISASAFKKEGEIFVKKKEESREKAEFLTLEFSY